MKKVIIQIPAFNEENSLPITLSKLPKTMPGIDIVEWLVIDDGSTDKTVEVAHKYGAHHVVSHVKNQGLAKTFMTGIEACLCRGADIIVNTDADNQYCADDIEKLVAPILNGKAEVVVGERPIFEINHFSISKKYLQKLGSWMVRTLSKTNVQDAPSGFRAYSRNAAMRLNVFNTYTYTLETIIQAGRSGISIASVPIRTNEDLRPSRLVKSVPHYIKQSVLTMSRVITTYKPLTVFLWLSAIPFLIGALLLSRWLLFYLGDTPATHIPSLILSIGCILVGIQLAIFGLIADIISVNRKLLEDIQYKLRSEMYLAR
ncbi:MAG: glycosyltransferase family 2 protein [Candidatus Margulisbacteria bacterium]|nr:glycosyltransferase family 2 protein [Candidatus Margulisiibacteriota bacterium]